MSDTLHERAACAERQLLEHDVARLAVRTAYLHLDELVIMQRPLGFLRHGIGKTRVPNVDHGVQGVRKLAQVSALALGEIHDGRLQATGYSHRGGGTPCVLSSL